MYPLKINAERLWNCCTQFFDTCSPSSQISLHSRFSCRQEPDQAQGVNPLAQQDSAPEATNPMFSFPTLAVSACEPGPQCPWINTCMRLLRIVCPSQIWKKSTSNFSGCQITLTFPKIFFSKYGVCVSMTSVKSEKKGNIVSPKFHTSFFCKQY